jgi:hypothetical protein
MISTFDLTLLGSLVSAGGLVFLKQGKWLALTLDRLGISNRVIQQSVESREHHARAAALAGARWLTVGGLTLFIAYVHGAEESYLFGPWTDVLFHLIFVSTCWGATAYRMKQAAERAAAMVPLTTSSTSQVST